MTRALHSTVLFVANYGKRRQVSQTPTPLQASRLYESSTEVRTQNIPWCEFLSSPEMSKRNQTEVPLTSYVYTIKLSPSLPSLYPSTHDKHRDAHHTSFVSQPLNTYGSRTRLWDTAHRCLKFSATGWVNSNICHVYGSVCSLLLTLLQDASRKYIHVETLCITVSASGRSPRHQTAGSGQLLHRAIGPFWGSSTPFLVFVEHSHKLQSVRPTNALFY